MTIYDADYALELQAQEDAMKWHQEAVQEPIAEVQEEPEAIQDEGQEFQEEAVEQKSRPVEESDQERNWRALREKAARAEELERENAYLRGKTERESERQAEPDEFSKLDDDEYLSKAQVKKYLEEFEAKNQQKFAEINFANDQERMRMQHKDYDEVVNNYSVDLIKNNPYFNVQFKGASNPAAYAYQIGKAARMEKQMMQPKEAPIEPERRNAERIVQNSRKPATLSSARGGSPQMSQADYWATMSESEFLSKVNKHSEEV